MLGDLLFLCIPTRVFLCFKQRCWWCSVYRAVLVKDDSAVKGELRGFMTERVYGRTGHFAVKTTSSSSSAMDESQGSRIPAIPDVRNFGQDSSTDTL